VGLLRYLFAKRAELEDLELKDAALAKAILDVHRKRTGKTVVAVPLFALHPVHAIDREGALEATAARAALLQQQAGALRHEGTLTCARLAEVLPSVSWIKVVQARRPPGAEPAYLAFEGNGRIAALQQVFHPEDQLRVEVERYDFRDPTKVLRRLHRVRRMNGLATLEP
jgi:hypothetical protein